MNVAEPRFTAAAASASASGERAYYVKVLSTISTLWAMMRLSGIGAGEADTSMAALRRVMMLACLEKVVTIQSENPM